MSTDAPPTVPPKASNRKVRGTWSLEEDSLLRSAVAFFGAKTWKKIALSVPGRTDVQCLHRWQKVLNPELVKGPWTAEEDAKVIELVKIHGAKKWSTIASQLPGRIGKQARERWANHLDPSVNKGEWEEWEDQLVIKLQAEYGNSWARIAKKLQGRTDNAIKNRFNSTIMRRLKNGVEAPPKKKVAKKPRKRARPAANASKPQTKSEKPPAKRRRVVKKKAPSPTTSATASIELDGVAPVAPVQVKMEADVTAPTRRSSRKRVAPAVFRQTVTEANDDGGSDYTPNKNPPSTPPRSAQKGYVPFAQQEGYLPRGLFSPTTFPEQSGELFLTTPDVDISDAGFSYSVAPFTESFQSPAPTKRVPRNLFSPSPGGAFSPMKTRSSTPSILSRHNFLLSPAANNYPMFSASLLSPDSSMATTVPFSPTNLFDSPLRTTPRDYPVPVRRQLQLDSPAPVRAPARSPLPPAPQSPYFQSLKHAARRGPDPTSRRQLNLRTVDRDAAAIMATALPNSPPPSPGNMRMSFGSLGATSQLKHINARLNETQVELQNDDISFTNQSVTMTKEGEEDVTDTGTKVLQMLSQSRVSDQTMVNAAQNYVRSPPPLVTRSRRKIIDSTKNLFQYPKENTANPPQRVTATHI